MSDERAEFEPNAWVTVVPAWAKATMPWAVPRVIGPPPGHDLTGDIRAVEMLIDDSGPRKFRGYLRIPRDVAQRMADGDGGWVEIAMWTPVLMPWSAIAFSAPSYDT